MAGAGYKLFNTGDVLLASEVNTYLMQQTVMVFANASARTTALSGVLAEGMLSYLADTNATEVYDGSSWVSVSGTGDITAVTAGTGLTGGGTTGAVTLTNDMATTITASGDIVVGTGNGTYDNLPIGTTGQVLTADTTVSPYKVKWAAASSGALTKISSTTFSNVGSQDIDNVFTSTYNTYLVIIKDFYSLTAADDVQIQMRYSTTTQNTGYYGARDTVAAAGTSTITGSNATAIMTISDTAGGSGSKGSGFFYVDFPDGGGNSSFALVYGKYYNANSAAFCDFGYDTGSAQTFTGFRIKTNNNDFYGTVIVYGLEK